MRTSILTCIAFLILVPCNIVCADILVFEETFADNSNGWTLGSEWQIGTATASTGHNNGNPDPGLDHTATADNGIAGVVIGGNAQTTLHDFWYLTSPIIDVSGNPNLELSLFRYLNSDYTPYMQNTIDVFDGTNWNTLWLTGGAPAVHDTAWTYMSFDVTPYINSNFRMRIGYNVGSAGAYIVSGWNVDDISLTTDPVPEPSSLMLLSGLGVCGLGFFRRRKD